MDELTQRLLVEQNECTLSWLKRDGRPAAAVVSFVLLDGRIAMTALETSARVKAIRRNPDHPAREQLEALRAAGR